MSRLPIRMVRDLRAGESFQTADIGHTITLGEELWPGLGLFTVMLGPPADATGLPELLHVPDGSRTELLHAIPISKRELEILRSDGVQGLWATWTRLARPWWDPCEIPQSLMVST